MKREDALAYLVVLNHQPIVEQLLDSDYSIGRQNMQGCKDRIIDQLEEQERKNEQLFKLSELIIDREKENITTTNNKKLSVLTELCARTLYARIFYRLDSEKQSVILTDDIRQDATIPPDEEESAAGYMVLDVDQTVHYFEDYLDAEFFVKRQLENNTSKIKEWDIYPLYAGKSVIINKQKPVKKLKMKTVAKRLVGKTVDQGLEFAAEHGVEISTELVGGSIRKDRIQYTEEFGVIMSTWIG